MKKSIKYLFIILIFAIMFLFIFNNIVTANSWQVDNFSAIMSSGDTGGAGKAAKNITGAIVEVIRIVGTGISIIMLTYMAIKYMTAAPSEKAEFKKSAVAFIVGAIILFATSNILTIIYNFATKNTST